MIVKPRDTILTNGRGRHTGTGRGHADLSGDLTRSEGGEGGGVALSGHFSGHRGEGTLRDAAALVSGVRHQHAGCGKVVV